MKLFYLVFTHNFPHQDAWDGCLVWWFPSTMAAHNFAQGVIHNRGLIALTESYEPLYASEHTTLRGVYDASDLEARRYDYMARMPNGDRLEKLEQQDSFSF